MPSTEFAIESYRVKIDQHLTGNGRFINLTSPDLGHGIRYKAIILFVDQNPFASQGHMGMIRNFGALNFDPVSVVAWFSESYFAGFYQVLSTEKPVTLKLTYADTSETTTKDIRWASLFTGVEYPGDYEELNAMLPAGLVLPLPT